MKKSLILILLALMAISGKASAQKAPDFQIYALRIGAMAYKTPVAMWSQDPASKDSVSGVFSFWLLKGSNGEKYLVDAGFRNGLKEAAELSVSYIIRPDSALLQLGIRPEEITDIIITHPHWDHINGVTFFPRAKVWIQQKDYHYFANDAWQSKDSSHSGFTREDVQALQQLTTSNRLAFIDGDNKTILPGITVFTGARHTYESQYVRIGSGKDAVIIASDNIWIYNSLEKNLPAPTYGTFDQAGQVAAIKRMKTMVADPRFILPGHDGAMYDRFEKISENTIRIK
ncbi:N-acyl homoserine lactonase family protein [Chitinophaga sp. Mgbs1]|uniref:N-acyl homoserine lactonase family protein n=1 Tax=Chitinophaga solisilvae TaxID=1233460 RepID=A0A3S1DL13_9BACT|nr:N-acyl homoserine lactonase family protein [Chitinophaga solisilvae]